MTDFVRAAGAAAAEVDGETVVLSPTDLRYHSLNDTAAVIWAHLAQPASVDRLVKALVAEFDVEEDECRRGVERCLAELTELGLVQSS